MKLNFNIFKKDKKKDVFKCKHCKMTFKEKEKLDVHAKKAHTGRENLTRLIEAGINLLSCKRLGLDGRIPLMMY